MDDNQINPRIENNNIEEFIQRTNDIFIDLTIFKILRITRY